MVFKGTSSSNSSSSISIRALLLSLWICDLLSNCDYAPNRPFIRGVKCDYYTPVDSFLINCGSHQEHSDPGNGRSWTGDAGNSSYSHILAPPRNRQGIPVSASLQDPDIPSETPFLTARIFTAPGGYSIPVTPGRHWVRLYFYPFVSLPPPFEPGNALVTVRIPAQNITLVSDLNVTAEVKSANLPFLYREFSVNLTQDSLNLTISPGKTATNTSVYALINGLEVISMPNLFLNKDLTNVNTQQMLSIPLINAVMETKYRLNMGGPPVSAEKDELSRTWARDISFIPTAAYGVEEYDRIANITILNYTAPAIVYRTARYMTHSNSLNLQFNLTWVMEADPGFSYYIRLHFCELLYNRPNELSFDVYLNGFFALKEFDAWGAANGMDIAVTRDFTLFLDPEKRNITLEIGVRNSAAEFYTGFLNGLEIFKINDSAGNLQGVHKNFSSMPELPLVTVSSQVKSKRVMIPVFVGTIGFGSLVIIVGLVFCLWFKKGRGGKKSSGVKSALTCSPLWSPVPPINSPSTMASNGSNPSTYASSAATPCRYFTLAEIREITSCFNETLVLGLGGFGKVYKGILDDGTLVAVKRKNPDSDQGMTEFVTEIETLSKLRHRHLVSLIGFCEEQNEMILVYDHMANGPLRRHLYGTSPPLPPLSWKKRLEICIGAARGIHYLHTGATKVIIHRDVKSTNILLDENLLAKVSDFGLSKTGPDLNHSHVSTAVKGSFGYLDPEYFRLQQLTEKSDVYSFGIVLLEVLCARPVINPNLSAEEVNIAEWAALMWEQEGTVDKIMDPRLASRASKESVEKFTETAQKCLAEEGCSRPSMGHVLWNLEYALQLHETSPELEFDSPSEQVKERIVCNSTCANDVSVWNNHVGTDTSDNANGSDVFSQLVNPQGR